MSDDRDQKKDVRAKTELKQLVQQLKDIKEGIDWEEFSSRVESFVKTNSQDLMNKLQRLSNYLSSMKDFEDSGMEKDFNLNSQGSTDESSN